jgi:GNAT superfamily N-acetyltransferase
VRFRAADVDRADGQARLLQSAEKALNRATVSAAEAEAIERATLAALPPRRLIEDDGWLLAENLGAIARINSALPLAPGRDPLADKIDRALGFYASAGLRPAIRVSPFAGPAGVAEALADRGFAPEERTVVMTAPADAVTARLAHVEPADPVGAPGQAWDALFQSPGVDPAKAAARLATLARGEGACFAQSCVDGRVVAVGVASVSGPWAGLHGMRTAADRRRQGHARAVLAALVAAVRQAGSTRLFLQAEADNPPALMLYAGLGFTQAYDYAYWRPPLQT